MSYILDALKRSQQERELGQTPTLFAETYTKTEPPQKTNRAVLIALALALLAVLISLYAVIDTPLFSDGRGKPAVSGPVVTPPASEIAVSKAALDLTAEKQPPADPEPEPANKKERPVIQQKQESVPGLKIPPIEPNSANLNDKPAKASADAQPGPTIYREELLELKQQLERQDKEIKPDIETETKISPAEEDNSSSIEPVSKQRRESGHNLLTEQQLSASLRSRLPGRDISVHVYSEIPRERFVFINSRKMQEGESTSEGLTVEEILPDGIIFSFEGKRFFKPL